MKDALQENLLPVVRFGRHNAGMSVLKLDRLQAYLRHLAGQAGPSGQDGWAARTPHSPTDFSIDESGVVVGHFQDFRITSAFQTAHRLDSGEVAGAQALVRSASGADGLAASPWVELAREVPADDLVALDRRSRTVHLLNYFRHDHSPADLYLSVHDRLLTAVADNHGRAFRRVLDTLGIQQGRIVIEVPAESAADVTLLANVVANYRLHGFRVAANVDRADQLARVLAVARLDVVKVDALRWAAFDADGQGVAVLAAARAQGCEVLFKRLERDEQRQHARAVGATLGSGYLFAPPVSARQWSASLAPDASVA